MRKAIGISCIVLGIVCIITSICFIFYNKYEDKNAEVFSLSILQDLQKQIENNVQNSAPSLPEQESNEQSTNSSDIFEQDSSYVLTENDQKYDYMPTLNIDGYDCIGFLSIPILELELPVLNNWTYSKLKKAPCLYYGSYYESDFVIAAHNFKSHFGRLSALEHGDIVLFTDATGNVYTYEVILSETLPGTATYEMITSGFDLSLYTCTLTGGSRITVRCNVISDQ